MSEATEYWLAFLGALTAIGGCEHVDRPRAFSITPCCADCMWFVMDVLALKREVSA